MIDSGTSARGVSEDVVNPLLPYARDPHVPFHDGRYLLTLTDYAVITIQASSTLNGLRRAEPKVIWNQEQEGGRDLWAPELHHLDGRWYVYYAGESAEGSRRQYVLESATNDPLGPYKYKGIIAAEPDRWAIDGTVLQTPSGARYFLWSGWEGLARGQQNIYIAEMNAPCTLKGPRVCISQPEHEWERRCHPPITEGATPVLVNEGPAPLAAGDRIFVAYSASGSWLDDYCLGLLEVNAGADLLDAGSWRKHPRPVFTSAENAFGPGHNCFFASPDGQETWHTYHANVTAGTGWPGASMRAQRVEWHDDGTPNLGRPSPTGVQLSPPSGERIR